MDSNETPRSMPLVYTVCCGATRSGGMIYVENGGVNIPCEKGTFILREARCRSLVSPGYPGPSCLILPATGCPLRHLISYTATSHRHPGFRIHTPSPRETLKTQ